MRIPVRWGGLVLAVQVPGTGLDWTGLVWDLLAPSVGWFVHVQFLLGYVELVVYLTVCLLVHAYARLDLLLVLSDECADSRLAKKIYHCRIVV